MNKGYPLNDPNYNWERRIRGISGDSLINTANSMSDEQKSAFRKAVDAGEPCAYIHTHYDDDEGEDVSTYDYDEIVSAVRNGVPVIWHYGDVGYDTFYMPSKQEYGDSDGSVYIHFLELVDANAT